MVRYAPWRRGNGALVEMINDKDGMYLEPTSFEASFYVLLVS